MGIGKRIVDLAKANLNALLDKANGESELDNLTDEELEAELRRRRERKQRQEEERKAAERAAENARKRGPGPMPPPPKREPKSERRAPPPSSGGGNAPMTDKRLRELYAQLEVPYGAPFDDVKKSFRRLMRKYHPDLHIGNPQKHKTATQLTMSLTQAYNELEQHLVGGPNRSR